MLVVVDVVHCQNKLSQSRRMDTNKSYTRCSRQSFFTLVAVFTLTLLLVRDVFAAPTGTVIFTGNFYNSELIRAEYYPEPESFAELDAIRHFGKREFVVRDNQDVEHLVRIYFQHPWPILSDVSVRMYVDGGEVGGVPGKPKIIWGNIVGAGNDFMHLGYPLPFVTGLKHY